MYIRIIIIYLNIMTQNNDIVLIRNKITFLQDK